MSDVICNTSSLQYLHQLGLLNLLPTLVGRVIIPSAVVDELAVGRSFGVNLPDPALLRWIDVRVPAKHLSLPNADDLGPGEMAVLALAVETVDAAEAPGLPMRGTLGLLLDAKKAGLVSSVATILDQLQSLRFRVSLKTRTAVLQRAGELS